MERHAAVFSGHRHVFEGGNRSDDGGTWRLTRGTSRPNQLAGRFIAAVLGLVLVFGMGYQRTITQQITVPPCPSDETHALKERMDGLQRQQANMQQSVRELVAAFSSRVEARPALHRSVSVSRSHAQRCTAEQAAAIAKLVRPVRENCLSTARWMPKFISASARSARPARLVSIGFVACMYTACMRHTSRMHASR